MMIAKVTAGHAAGSWAGRVLALLAFAALLLVAAPSFAQQAPAKADDKLLLQYLQGKAPSGIDGRISIPDARAARLVQPEGRSWQETQGTVKTIGAVAILGMVGVLILFYMSRGKIKIDAGPSTARIMRFTSIERFAHWLTAVSFILLALTGVNLVWGKHILLPARGPEAFTALSDLGKLTHNYISFAFCAGVVLMLVLWVSHNVPNAADAEWLRQGGGLLKKGVHPPSEKFNAGQKLNAAFSLGAIIVLLVTGTMMFFSSLFPDALRTGATFVHDWLALAFVVVVLGHIYMAFNDATARMGMRTGSVPVSWAQREHGAWAAEQLESASSPAAPAAAETIPSDDPTAGS